MKNENENSLIGLEETNSLFQLWMQFKNSIFNVLFVLLNQSDDEEDESILGLCIETGLDYFQMMSFPFHDAVLPVWNGGETLSAFTSIFANLKFSQFIPGVSFETFLMMLYFLIFVIILVILDIIYVSYSFSKKKFKFTWPLEFLAKVVPLCVTVFFLPIMETLLSVVSCQKSEDLQGTQVMESFPDIICWEGWHMFHAVITLFFTSIFVFISSIVALTIFEPRMTTNRLTARQNSTGQVIFILNKMICQFVFSFTPFQNSWIYCVMLFVFSGWLWTSYNVEQPFYNKSASKFFRICSSYYFWTNTMLLASQVLLDYGFEGGLVVWMCGLPFIGISILFERKSNIEKLFSSNLKFRSGEELEAHLQYVLQLIHNRDKDKNSYMLLLGYIEKHIEICMEENCPLKVKKLKKEEDLAEIEQNCQQLIKQLLRMYKDGVKKYPTCTRLRLSFAFFYMQKLQSNNKAYEEFSIAQNTSPTFGEEFIIYRFKKIIRENLEQNDKDDDNDLIEIIRFDNHVSLCEQAMLYSARLHKDFWAELEEETPDLKKLNSVGSRITQTAMTVKENYREIHKINSHVSEVIHNYAIYLIFIGQSHLEGKVLLEQAKRIYFEKKEKDENDMGIFTLKNSEYGDLTAIEHSFNSMIKVSLEEDAIGKIIYANDAFTELTGYVNEDITERTIEKILPSIYNYHHKNAIKMWISDDTKKILDSNNTYLANPHNGFVKQKGGFLMPVNYRISFNTEENYFLAVMRSDPFAYTEFNCKIYIITNAQGVIKDISPLGYMYFRICKEEIQNTEFYLDEIGVPLIKKREEIFSKNGLDTPLRQILSAKTLKYTTLNYGSLGSKLGESTPEVDAQEMLENNDQTSPQSEQFNIKGEQVWINANEDLEEALEDESFFSNGKLKIGYVYTLQKIDAEIHVNQNQEKNTELNLFDDLLHDMYKEEQKYMFSQINDPVEVNRLKKSKILADMVLTMNNGHKISFEQKKFRNYAQQLKIKTYRYWDKDFTRIYNIEYENDQNNNFQYENDELCTKADVERLEKKHYQDKIRDAINTNIQHEEIRRLRRYSLFFFLVLAVLLGLSFIFTLDQLYKISETSSQNYQRVQDVQYVTQILQKSIQFNSQTIPNDTLQQMKIYQLKFDPDQAVECELENNRIEKKGLLEAMNIIKARVMNYFSSQSVSKNISIAYKNYLLSVYPLISELAYYQTIQISPIIIISAFIVANSLFMIIFWVYNIMKIDQKRFDIMIWFLDIPIDYVVYLENNCNRFIKNYIPIKELEERGINMDDKEHYCDQFEQKKVEEDEEIDEENKARKIMIARHRKKTFMSRFNCGYLTTLWLLFYTSIVTVFFMSEIIYEKGRFEFINEEWNVLNREFLWSSTFPIVLSLKKQGYTDFQGRNKSLNVDNFAQNLRQNFLNTLTKNNNSKSIKELIDQNAQISDVYSEAYYGDLCEFIAKKSDDPESSEKLEKQCSSILNAKLRGGITTYTSYLVNYNASQIDSIVKAHYDVVGPAIMTIFKEWKDYFVTQAHSLISLSNVVTYLYITLTVLGYVSLWMIYLQNQNTKMNQTIQMLNMIPMKMLPKNRKDTRDFLNWLIDQANKKKQGDDQ